MEKRIALETLIKEEREAELAIDKNKVEVAEFILKALKEVANTYPQGLSYGELSRIWCRHKAEEVTSSHDVVYEMLWKLKKRKECGVH